MRAVRPEFEIRPLIYGLPDYAAENFVRTDLGYNRGRPLFATVGSFERRKGHDIFCKAIRLLPPEVREKASFLFVGQAADKEMMVSNIWRDALASGISFMGMSSGDRQSERARIGSRIRQIREEKGVELSLIHI